MSRWEEVWRAAPRAPSARFGRLAAPVVIVVALVARGHLVAAALVLGAAVVLTLVGATSAPAAILLDRVEAGIGHAIGRAISFMLLGVVAVIVVFPAALVARLARRDLLATSPGWSTSTAPRAQARRPFGSEPAERSRRWTIGLRLVAQVVGGALVLAAVNYAVGWMWDEQFERHVTPTQIPAFDPADVTAVSSMGSAAWAPDYWREFDALIYAYRPYLLSRVAPTEGRYIRVEGPIRHSYQARDLPDDAPVVWFLGGSALWGVGQRDEHTIPSEVARLAEAAGTPVRVVNLGQPGYTSWQSALLLEQELAVRPPPDLVVAYDGAADVAVQLEDPSDAPTHFNVPWVTTDLVGRDSAREQLDDWWREYQETSVVNRVVRCLRAQFGAQQADAEEPGIVDRVVDLHARSVDLAGFVAAQHDVSTLFVWQAAAGVAGDGGAYRRVTELVGPGPSVDDLGGLLDGTDEPVYLDGVLTNEAGASVVASALWDRIGARVR